MTTTTEKKKRFPYHKDRLPDHAPERLQQTPAHYRTPTTAYRFVKDHPSAIRLRELFRYNASTGQLLWKVSRGRVKAGSVAGTVLDNGYRCIRIDGVRFIASHIVFCIERGFWFDRHLYHIDADRGNDRLENLSVIDPRTARAWVEKYGDQPKDHDNANDDTAT